MMISALDSWQPSIVERRIVKPAGSVQHRTSHVMMMMMMTTMTNK